MSFLEVKLRETERLRAALGAEIPVVLMTSFATDEAVRAHVAERELGAAAVRSRRRRRRGCGPTAACFSARTGSASLYGPGTATCSAPSARRARSTSSSAAASRSVVVTNVDNLGARIDPAIVGHAPARGNAAHRRGRRQGQGQRRRSGAGGRPAAARRGVPLPARLRPEPRSRSSTRTPSLITVEALRRAGRPHLAPGREAGRRRAGGAVRAALPRALGARPDHVPRRAAPRPAGTVPAGQGAGRPRGGEAASTGDAGRRRRPEVVPSASARCDHLVRDACGVSR